MKKFQLLILYFQRVLSRIFKKSTSFKASKIVFSNEGGNRKVFPDLKYLIVFILISLGLVVVWKVAPQYVKSQEGVSLGYSGYFRNENLPISITNLLSKSLITLDNKGAPQPNLLSKWEVSEDSKKYTLSLKSDQNWNDNSQVKSSDIKFQLPNTEIIYPNDQTIELKLDEPFAPLPSFLTYPVFKNGSLTGMGKFKIVKEQTDKGFITSLTLNSLNSDEVMPEVKINFYEDELTSKTAFELGEIDALIGVTHFENFLNQPSIKIKSVTDYTKLVAIFYDLGDPILSDENIRHSLTLSTPVIEGEERAKTSIPAFFWAFNQEVKSDLGNYDKAKEYLKKVPNIKDKTITLTTTPALSQVGEKVVQSWKNIGINAVLRVESGVPQKFQALLITESIPQDPDQYLLWHSTQTKFNISSQPFAPRVDRDLEEGRKTSDIEKRKEYYLDFQKVLADNSVATFLYFPKFHIVYRQKSETNINKILPLQINNSQL